MNFNNSQKPKILIVDDSEMNRSILADMLDDEYEILEAEDGTAAIAMLQKYTLDISLVLLDVVMPRMDGFEVLTVMNQKHWIEEIPVIMISAESGSSSVKLAYELGVTDFIARPFDTLIVRRRVVNTILLYAKQKKLMGMLAEQIEAKERMSSMMVDILSSIMEFRNGESGQHIVRVRTLTEVFLRWVREKTDRYPITQDDIFLICTASALHDVGKIAINESILNKPGRLTAEEFEIMKTHSLVGAEMLRNLPAYEDEPLVKTAYEICRWHHERYDGRGYPDGLSGDEIPISAQIVALADVFDALTSDRCYKKAYSREKSVQMIVDGQCGTFNPLLVECLQEVVPTLPEELETVSARTHHLKLTTSKEPIVSERSLRLLDHERIKYNFFAAMTEEIQFEYTVTPDMLTLSSWGAQKLNLEEVILKPFEKEEVLRVFGVENSQKLSGMLRATTPENPVVTYECILRYTGQARWHRFVARAMWSSDDPPVYTGSIGKFMDIHDSVRELKSLQRQASHDALTGLLYRANAKKKIQERIQSNPNGNYLLAILDLDSFKAANDNRGHMFGDRVLQYVAEKLRQNTRREDIIARVGGDEFLIFLECKTNAEGVLQRILDALTGRFEGFPLGASIGAASNKTVGNEYDKLFHAADQALYFIKRKSGGQCCYYDDSMGNMLSAISTIDQDRKEE